MEKQKDGTCHDVVRITSATENFEKKEVLHELCGLRNLQTLTFESNIILEFESDNAVEDAGFFAEVFTMSKFANCLFFLHFQRLWILDHGMKKGKNTVKMCMNDKKSFLSARRK